MLGKKKKTRESYNQKFPNSPDIALAPCSRQFIYFLPSTLLFMSEYCLSMLFSENSKRDWVKFQPCTEPGNSIISTDIMNNNKL